MTDRKDIIRDLVEEFFERRPREVTTVGDEHALLYNIIHQRIFVGSVVRTPIEMRITCPDCGELHIDEGEFATKPHHTHSCQKCGLTWRPCVLPTVGVRFLPGFKNEEKKP